MTLGADPSHTRDPHLLALFPTTSDPAAPMSVRGRYLDPESGVLQEAADSAPERPLIYANFVTSLDGRIALGDTEEGSHVPRALTTRADWRLFQELQAHADCFITHGAYLRALAAGRLSDILQVGLRQDSADLLAWRHGRGLTRQPAVVIASRSLDFVLPDSLGQHDQSVVVVTSSDAPEARVRHLREESGVNVMVADTPGPVGASLLVEAVRALGCSRAYLEAGPTVLGAMLRERYLGRLYLTLGHRLLGGDAFHTLVNGAPLQGCGELSLEQLYLLTGENGQFFARFRPRP
ncbi:MAG: dihydrofolate reductase family protein [Pseudomonadota bacterium]